jgi:hypothetical protein
MEWLIGVVVVVLAIAVFAMRRRPPVDQEARAKNILEERNILEEMDRERAAKKSRQEAQWHPIIDRMPIVDAATSPLIHRPVYDCVSDEFELPCGHPSYQLHNRSVHVGMVFGFIPTSEVREMIVNFSDWSGPVCVVNGGDHIYLLYAGSIRESGSKVWRFVRTGADEFHVYAWRSGMRPSAGPDDPPYFVAAMAENPQKWLDRMKSVQRNWDANSNYQYEERRCGHRKS